MALLPTQETQAATIANQILALTAAMYSITQQISAVSAGWTNLSVANKLNVFPTAPGTTTGGLGTADSTPNVANPIDVRVAPGSAINVAVSSNNIAGMLTYLQGIQLAINGSAVSANGAAAQLLAIASGF